MSAWDDEHSRQILADADLSVTVRRWPDDVRGEAMQCQAVWDDPDNSEPDDPHQCQCGPGHDGFHVCHCGIEFT